MYYIDFYTNFIEGIFEITQLMLIRILLKLVKRLYSFKSAKCNPLSLSVDYINVLQRITHYPDVPSKGHRIK